jgi:serine/threonine protein kinase
MDYLLGQSLDLYSKKNTITLCVRTKLQMLYYVAQALRYLKNHGVVHSGLNQ